MIITLDGLPGSGNTTATENVAKALGYKIVTAGEIFKQFAKDHGVPPGELSKFWDTALGKSPETHHKLDNMQLEKANEAKKKNENVIFNGKLAAFHLKDIADLKIFLTAPLDIRAKRNSGRDNVPFEQTKLEIQKRVDSERTNWKKMYHFDYAADTEYYDFILNTGKLGKEEVSKILVTLIRNWRK